MLSNIIDWMIDGLCNFKWLVEDIANWWFDSVKTSLHWIGRRIKKMRVYIDISQAAFTHFAHEAREQGVSVRTLLSGEVEALYCNALEEKWREEDFEEVLKSERRREEEDYE